MKTATMTREEVAVAKQSIAGAREMIKAGNLFVGGVQVRTLGRINCMQVFPPGVRELVRRYYRGPVRP